MLEDTRFLEDLLDRLRAKQPILRRRNSYYSGTRTLQFLAEGANIDARSLDTFHANVSRVAVRAVAQRMRISKIRASYKNRDISDRAQALWRAGDMDAQLPQLLTDLLALGSAYISVWTDSRGKVRMLPESAEQVLVRRDPMSGDVVEAIKTWQVVDRQDTLVSEHVVYYTPTYIQHYVRNNTAGHLEHDGEQIYNPLGYVPIVPLCNAERIGDQVGYSVLDDLGPLVDAYSKLLADVLVASEDLARPKRWATGVELEETDAEGFSVDEDGEIEPNPLEGQAGRPFEDSDDMWISENSDAKFGQLSGATLSGYKEAVGLVLQAIAIVSGLSPSNLGQDSANPTSADAIRASESTLVDEAESRHGVATRPLEDAIRLELALELDADPDDIQVQVRWRDPATVSIGALGDFAQKMYAIGALEIDELRSLVGLEEL